MKKSKGSMLILGLAIAAVPELSVASVIGSLGNFDVINDTGHIAHGFEIELEDLHSSDISDVFGRLGFNPGEWIAQLMCGIRRKLAFDLQSGG